MENKAEVLAYLPSHRLRFKEINEQWITRGFELEEEDIRTLEDPENYILKNGGKIFIAIYEGKVVGTIAYLNFGNHVYELIKMAVDEKYRGLKIGRLLGEMSLQNIKENGARTIYLFSNRKGSALAIELYRKLGFEEVALGNSEFLRADIRMELNL